VCGACDFECPTEFILFGKSSHSRRKFYRLPFTPPLSGRLIGPSSVSEPVESLLTLVSLRSKDGVPGTEFGFSTLLWEELPDVK
jgi:hypothetical protein